MHPACQLHAFPVGTRLHRAFRNRHPTRFDGIGKRTIRKRPTMRQSRRRTNIRPRRQSGDQGDSCQYDEMLHFVFSLAQEDYGAADVDVSGMAAGANHEAFIRLVARDIPRPPDGSIDRCEGVGRITVPVSAIHDLNVCTRKIEIARALVRNPAILMLDEPFAGVDPLSVNEIQDIVRRLAAQGLGIIITDHNVRETLSVVHRAYLVYNGRLLREGTSEDLVNDPEVREKYLGENFRM